MDSPVSGRLRTLTRLITQPMELVLQGRQLFLRPLDERRNHAAVGVVQLILWRHTAHLLGGVHVRRRRLRCLVGRERATRVSEVFFEPRDLRLVRESSHEGWVVAGGWRIEVFGRCRRGGRHSPYRRWPPESLPDRIDVTRRYKTLR